MIEILDSWLQLKKHLSCQHCQYANYYPAYWWCKYYDPWCSKGHGKCTPTKYCEDFQLIGRLSR